ncbi:ImuA family protein [Roseivivax sp. CAU 1761]
MLHPPLARKPHTPLPALEIWPGLALPTARLHEICGAARRTLALHLAARAAAAGGPVLWIAPEWGADPLNPDGVAALLPPGALLFVTARRGEDLLWAMEEALRAGAAPVVVADLAGPPGLTPVRRLHLAAEAGAAETGQRPLGLILTPGEGGAPGVETRLRLDPAHRPERSLWHLVRLRARMAPPRDWWLSAAGPGGRDLAPVPPPGPGAGPETDPQTVPQTGPETGPDRPAPG